MADQGKRVDQGLLLLRVLVGVVLVRYGIPELLAGERAWRAAGKLMAGIGIETIPTFWGLLFVLAQAAGGVALALGMVFRPACLLLLLHAGLSARAGWSAFAAGDRLAGHWLCLVAVFGALLLSGAGGLNVGRTVSWLNGKWYQ